MNGTVQPIRDIKKVNAMKKILLSTNYRDYCFFVLGLNSGLRISDLLALQFKDVLKGEAIVNDIVVKEKKTKKIKSFKISDKTKKIIEDYIKSVQDFDLEDPLFFSRKKVDGKRKALTRQHAHYIMKTTADMVGIQENIGTHSLRKSFGYHAYKKGVDLAYLQKVFNHSSQRQTLDYIGITKEEIDNIYITIDL